MSVDSENHMPKPRKPAASAKPSRRTVKPPPSVPVAGMVREIDDDAVRQAIASRAYDLFLRRGATHGHDWADWLTAERELWQTLRESMTTPDYAD